jgi:hypothetical protein
VQYGLPPARRRAPQGQNTLLFKTDLGGIAKRSLTMARSHREKTIAKAFGLDDATQYESLQAKHVYYFFGL